MKKTQCYVILAGLALATAYIPSSWADTQKVACTLSCWGKNSAGHANNTATICNGTASGHCDIVILNKGCHENDKVKADLCPKIKKKGTAGENCTETDVYPEGSTTSWRLKCPDPATAATDTGSHVPSLETVIGLTPPIE
jgi:hypothetical protein